MIRIPMNWFSRTRRRQAPTTDEQPRPSDSSHRRRRRRGRRDDRGDAGLPLLLITPALLFIVLHLINASQQLYERREAYSVAAAAARFGNQADQLSIRDQSVAAIDEAKSRASIQNFVASEGYTVVSLSFDDDRGDGTFTITVEVEKTVDYIFPITSALSPTVTGRAESVLNRGVSGPGSP